MEYLITKKEEAVLAGRYYNTQINDTAVYVIKLSPLGNVIWAKKIRTDYKYSRPYNLIELANGDILFASFDAYDGSILNITKLNSSGNLVWAKNLFFSDTDSDIISDLNVYSNNNDLYLTCMLSPALGKDQGNMVTAVMKLDALADVVWAKYYNSNYGYTLTIPVGLIKVADSLLVLGRMPANQNGNLGESRESSYYGMKLSEQNGSLGKSVAYSSPTDFGTSFGVIGLGSSNFIFNITAAKNNEYYFSTLRYWPGLNTGKRDSYRVRFDADLNTYEGSLYTTGSLTYKSGRIKVDKNGNTDIVYSSTDSTDFGNQYIAKLDRNGNTIRQKRLLPVAGSQAYSAGRNPFAYKQNYMSLVTNYKNANGSFLQLTQLNNEEQNSSCFGTDTSFIKITPYTFTPYLSPFFDYSTDLGVVTSDIAGVQVSDLVILKEDVCEQISVCNSIKLSGTKIVCDVSQPYIYKSKLNGGCYKHTAWQIDSTVVDELLIVDDTTVSIKYKKSFHGYLYATINACTTLKDSIAIDVFVSPASINLGNDTAFCTGDKIYLHAQKDFKTYEWQNGFTDSIFVVNKAGKYFVKTSDYCGHNFYDTINITENFPSVLNLGNDTSICTNQTLILDAGAAFTQYNWSTGGQTQTIAVSNAGEYIVTAKNIGQCISKDSITIIRLYPLPVFSLDKNSSLCKGQNDTLFVDNLFKTYLWQDGSKTNFYKVVSPAKLKLSVTNEYGCMASDSVTIKKLVNIASDFLGSTISICKGETVQINPLVSFTDYTWSNGAKTPTITVATGKYWLTVKDNYGCKGVDTVDVLIKDCETIFWVPKSFTPNNDGLNELFKPYVKGRIEFYQLVILNRWGQTIFTTTDTNSGWDGTLKGALQNTGVYIWYCKYKVSNEKEIITKGTLMLLR